MASGVICYTGAAAEKKYTMMLPCRKAKFSWQLEYMQSGKGSQNHSTIQERTSAKEKVDGK